MAKFREAGLDAPENLGSPEKPGASVYPVYGPPQPGKTPGPDTTSQTDERQDM
ncbi:MAG: hypothetical protein Q9M12_09020 [Mariprofundus sp.]|nr:hypothetical protein [Mariprofundus sp.]